MKKLFAFLVAISMLVGITPIMTHAEVITLDSLIGNELTNGTFESGTDGWTASDGVTIASDMATTNNNSAKSMKVTGAGTVTSSVNLYKQELYDVSLWVKPANGNSTVTVQVGTETVISAVDVSQATVLNGKVRIEGTSKSGAALTEDDYDVVVTIDGDCYIDDVVIKASEEKIVNAVSSENFGDWEKASGSTGTLSYETVGSTSESAFKLTGTKNANAVQYIAVKKGVSYVVSADVYLVNTTATNNALYLYWSSDTTTRQNIKLAEIKQDEWKTVTRTIENTYPTAGASGDMAGIYVSFGGTVSSTFYLKNISVKEVKTTSSYAAPSVTLTAEKAATISPVVTPTVDDGDSAYYMYRYSVDGVAVDTGFGAVVPGYAVGDDFEGTVSIDVTPVNSQGTYGETKTVSLIYEAEALVNEGVSDLDSALNNKIINGTFENGMPSGWTLSGLTMTAETVNVAENSFTAAKLAGSGTIEVNPTIYGNELYDASISVKPVSGNVNVSLVADFGNGLEYTVFNGAATSGSWTKLSGNLLRFIGTAYKNSAAVTASPKLILNVDGSCYIDEFTLTPAKNLLLSTDGIRVMSSNDGTEVGGWYNRGNVAAEKTSDGVKITATDGINNCIAQYVVLEKNSTYTLKANLKAVDAAADGECTVYGAYSGAKFANVAITDDGVLFEKTIDLSSKDVADIVASCVAFTDADMYVSNASLVKDVKFAAPSATVVLDATAIQGDSVSAVAVPSFIEGDAVGYKYSYKLDNVTVKAGYATGDTIPAVTVPQPEGNTGSLTLTLIPVNTEGSYGAAYTSAPCTVSRHFVVNADSVPASSITAGGTVSLNVNVENNSDGNQTIAVIAAYYENNAMINCDILQQEITAGNDKDYSLSVALPGTITGNGNFSVFVWKGYDGNVFSMEPVSPVINPIN